MKNCDPFHDRFLSEVTHQLLPPVSAYPLEKTPNRRAPIMRSHGLTLPAPRNASLVVAENEERVNERVGHVARSIQPASFGGSQLGQVIVRRLRRVRARVPAIESSWVPRSGTW